MQDFARHIEAMDKIAALVSVRERNIKEVKERLKSCDFSPEEISDAIESAVRTGIIDEERYASAFIRGKISSGWGKNKICQRLTADGISSEIIQNCSNLFLSQDEEYNNALKALQKHPCTSKNPYASYMRRLISKGYSYDIANRAVNEFLCAC